jgi:DNA-binding NarL/FixJ family response regulator
MALRIVIIEDNKEIRESFSLLVESLSKHTLIAAYDNCEDAIKNIQTDKPELILMDIKLPGMDGIAGTAEIKKLLPNVHIIIVSVFYNHEQIFNALCAGAIGYLTKTSNYDEILSAINQAEAGGAPMSVNIAKMVVQSFHKNPKSPLSTRETEVLALLAEGKIYDKIAEELFISKETVKFHIKNIYLKLQVVSRSEAIDVARKNKFI